MNESGFPIPRPVPISGFSPSLANDLFECPFRVSFYQDEDLRTWRRPTTFGLLGEIAHAVSERVSHTRSWPESENSIQQMLGGFWKSESEQCSERLAIEWMPATTPNVEAWPGYELTRARTIRRLLHARPRAHGGPQEAALRPKSVEVQLADPESGLTGRVDRI